MNISLVKLGHEQCETCVTATLHEKLTGHSTKSPEAPGSCSVCERYIEHLRYASTSRSAYRDDGEDDRPGTIALAVDLQKVRFPQ